MAACARALDSVSACKDTEDAVDISKELHALEADVLRACVVDGTDTGGIPWSGIMHAASQNIIGFINYHNLRDLSAVPFTTTFVLNGLSTTVFNFNNFLLALHHARRKGTVQYPELHALRSSGGAYFFSHRCDEKKRKQTTRR